MKTHELIRPRNLSEERISKIILRKIQADIPAIAYFNCSLSSALLQIEILTNIGVIATLQILLRKEIFYLIILDIFLNSSLFESCKISKSAISTLVKFIPMCWSLEIARSQFSSFLLEIASVNK